MNSVVKPICTERRIFHRSGWIRPAAISMSVVATLFISGSGIQGGADRFERAIAIAVILLIWLACWRVANVYIEAGPTGVTIRNTFTTHYYDWKEVDEFRTGGGSMDLRAFGSPATIWLADGRKKYVTAIQPVLLMDVGRFSSSIRVCDDLNSFRRESLEGKAD